MARTDKTDTSKWVARAAATGGGKTYRGQRPMKWYASLVLICLLGVAMIVYSRYERQHPTATPPTVGTQWFAAIAFDVCGTVQPDLPSNPNASKGLGIDTPGGGVISIAPLTTAQAGANATLGAFVSNYPGLVLTPSALRLPKKAIHHNGDTCASGTPDAGKTANVAVRTWTSFTAQGSTVSGDPTSVLLGDGQLITVAFVPNGASIPKPPSQSIADMQDAIQAAASPTTTTPVSVPPTTTPVSVSTTTTPKTSGTTSR
jgi:hypothetical protein